MGDMGERRYKIMYEYVEKSEYALIRKELEQIRKGASLKEHDGKNI